MKRARIKKGAALQTSRRRQAASLSRRELRKRSFKAKRRAVMEATPPSGGSIVSALAGLQRCGADGGASAESRALALQSLRTLRSLLSASNDENDLDAVVASGVVPFLAALVQHPTAALRVEACWCLANVAAGEAQHAQAVLPTAALMIRIASGGAGGANASLVDAAVWCIGNLAAEEDATRGGLVRLGALAPIVRIARDPTVSLMTARMAAWSLSNLARTHPAAGTRAPDEIDLDGVVRVFAESGAVGALVTLMQRALASAGGASEETRAECARAASEVAWAMMFLGGLSPHFSAELHRLSALRLLTQIVASGSALLCGERVRDEAKLLIPVLRCIGNIVGSSRTLAAQGHATPAHVDGARRRRRRGRRRSERRRWPQRPRRPSLALDGLSLDRRPPRRRGPRRRESRRRDRRRYRGRRVPLSPLALARRGQLRHQPAGCVRAAQRRVRQRGGARREHRARHHRGDHPLRRCPHVSPVR